MKQNIFSIDLEKLPWWKGLAVLLLLAFFLRITLILCWSPVISRDSVHYLQIAQNFADGQLKSALKGGYPPGYPLMILPFLKLGFSPEMAGRSASIVAGLASLVFLFLLILPFGKKWALGAGLLMAIQPYGIRYSVMVLSESVFCAAMLGAWFCFSRGLVRRKKIFFLGAGFFVAMAYATRAEGLLMLVVFSCWLFFSKQLTGKKTKLKALALFWTATLLLVLPYLFYLKKHPAPGMPRSKDSWKLTQKGSFYVALQGLLIEKQGGKLVWKFNPQGLVPFMGRYFLRWIKNFLRMIEIGHPLFFALALLGLFASLEPPWREIRWGLLVFIFLELAMVSLVRVSSRLVLQPALILPLLSVWGLMYLYEKPFWGNKIPWLWLILVISSLAIGLRPLGVDKIYLRKGGEWLKNNGGACKIIATQDIRIAFYGGVSKWILLNNQKLPFSSPAQRESYISHLFAQAKQARSHWLALDIRYWKGEKSWGHWKLVKVFFGPKHRGISLWKKKSAS